MLCPQNCDRIVTIDSVTSLRRMCRRIAGLVRRGAAGGGERSGPGDPVHPQCAARLPRLLAGVQHHGRDAVQRPVLQLRGQRTATRRHVARSRQRDLRESCTSQLLVEQPDRQLRQRPGRLSRAFPSGTSRTPSFRSHNC